MKRLLGAFLAMGVLLSSPAWAEDQDPEAPQVLKLKQDLVYEHKQGLSHFKKNKLVPSTFEDGTACYIFLKNVNSIDYSAVGTDGQPTLFPVISASRNTETRSAHILTENFNIVCYATVPFWSWTPKWSKVKEQLSGFFEIK